MLRLIIFLLPLVGLLHQTGDVYREDREHHHSQGGQHHRQYFPRRGDGINITPYGGNIHKGPPQRTPVVRHHRVHLMFQHKEDKTGKIHGGHQHGDVRGKQPGRFAARQPAHHDGQRRPSPQQRDKAQEITDFGRESDVIEINDI